VLSESVATQPAPKKPKKRTPRQRTQRNPDPLEAGVGAPPVAIEPVVPGTRAKLVKADSTGRLDVTHRIAFAAPS
jgi:hypothetical protein